MGNGFLKLKRYKMQYARLLIVLIVIVIAQQSEAQIFLQLEKSESVDVKKFYAGDKIKYKTTQIDKWQEGIIMKVLPDGNSLLFSDQLLSVEDITYVNSYS